MEIEFELDLSSIVLGGNEGGRETDQENKRTGKSGVKQSLSLPKFMT